ncbi:MAG: SusC/RagA family TonB-linked outer membrane protein [Chitinophagaceae bacterium BSSC1]|nr:MAG: SusC/RagA family TonB-linked outer membrane protein [Chitinophagaceae bacterium BSSC1]
MRKKLLLSFCAWIFALIAGLAQTTTVTGKVTDDKGKPIEGAAVVEKKSKGGTATDANGVFKLTVKPGAILVISGTGFEKREVAASEAGNVSLKTADENLSEVVVTALGIKREKKALGYAVSSVGKKDLELRPEGDLGRVLSGKAPGVNIGATSGLSGSGTNIVIRGVNTINGSSQPLFVVDGVPFDGGTNTQASFVYGNQTSSRFLDLDPNNIESVDVLKGLSATTMYGELGRNGVILVTTKNGATSKARKKTEITVSQSMFTNTVANLPEYNESYGGGFDLSLGLAFFSNWGAKFTNPAATVPHPYDRNDAMRAAFPEYVGKTYEYKYYNSVPKFFKTGTVSNTSVNVAGTAGAVNYNANFGYLDDQGFVQGNGLTKNTFGFGGSAKLTNKVTVSGTFNYVSTDQKSPPTSTSFGSSASATSVFGDVMYTPTAVDLMGLPWENPLTHGHVYYRNGNDIQNPIWTTYNAFTQDKVNRAYGNLQIRYEVLKGLNLSYRVGFDNYSEFQMYAQNKGGQQYATGIYRTSAGNNNIWDHTVLAQYKTDINSNWDLNVDAGVNSRENTYSQTGTLSKDQLVYGLLDHTNFVVHDIVSENGSDLDYKRKSQSIGAFASATFGYNQYLYLNLGGRNSWTSTLEKANRSIFYPSASVSFVPTSAIPALQNNKYINYLKVRLGYATSAGFPGAYETRPVLDIATRTFLDRSGTPVNTNAVSNFLPNPDLKPELQTEFEAGIDGKFLKNRLTLDLTLYNRISKDQLLNRDLDPATGYTGIKINAGQVSNKGVEMGLGYTFIQNKAWNWKVDALWTINQSMVSDIPTDLKEIVYAGYSNLGNFAINGQPLGVIKGYYWQREAKTGQRIVSPTGDYISSQAIGIIGDPTPMYKLTGISNLSYKGLTFRMQWEYTCGGDMYSSTARSLIARGVTKDTEFDRAAPYLLPGVDANGNPNRVQTSATQAFFNNGFGPDESGMFDATLIRLRELSLAYSLPEKLLAKTPFGGVSFTLSGTNLWYNAPNFPKYTHFDPETNGLGVSNGRGLEFITGPSSRRIGASLRITF